MMYLLQRRISDCCCVDEVPAIVNVCSTLCKVAITTHQQVANTAHFICSSSDCPPLDLMNTEKEGCAG